MRHRGTHHRAVAFLFHAEHTAAARVEVAHHVAHVFLGYGHFDDVDRLQQHRVGGLKGQLEDLAAGRLEGDVLGVDRVFLAVEDDGLYVHDRIAGDNAVSMTDLTPFSIEGKNELLIAPPKTSLVNT